MSHEGFNGEQVSTIFIQMSAKGMTKRVASETLFPAKAPFMCMDVPGEKESINGTIFPVLLWKEKSPRSSASKPVLRKNIQGMLRENGISVTPVF